MHQWLFKSSKLEKILDLIFIFLFFYTTNFVIYDLFFFSLMLLLAFYRIPRLKSIQNSHGKWLVYYQNKSLELARFRLLLDTKYALLCLARPFYSRFPRIIIIFCDQFHHEDEAYFRYVLQILND